MLTQFGIDLSHSLINFINNKAEYSSLSLVFGLGFQLIPNLGVEEGKDII